ncbi:MAG: hypothetical protein JJT78_14540, partial [Leptospira sp.]|nr:hypothetical protein [Leptospira sp.]
EELMDRVKKIIFLLLIFVNCQDKQKHNNEILPINRFLLVEIDITYDKEGRSGGHSRQVLLNTTKILKNYSPSLVYLNYFFVDEMIGMPNFGHELNDNIKTISLLSKSKSDSSFDVKKYLGNSIKGVNHNNFPYFFHKVGGFQSPVKDILENSEFLCYSIMFDVNSIEEDYFSLSPYVDSNGTLIETCPFAISKKILFDYYGIELEFEIDSGRFNALEKKNQRSIIFSEYSRVYNETGMFPVKIYKFDKMNYKEIVNTKTNLDKHKILFVGSKENKVRDLFFEKVYVLEAEISFVYMFVNDILNKFVEKYPDYEAENLKN